MLLRLLELKQKINDDNNNNNDRKSEQAHITHAPTLLENVVYNE